MISEQSDRLLLTFQSTHPHGVRHLAKKILKPEFYVSIHAPTRGATFDRERADMYYKFQSTHPHGVRLSPAASSLISLRFNPRTHTGCDTLGGIRSLARFEFQSTHPHGVRQQCCRRHAYLYRFQSTHPHGVRRLVYSLSLSG